eukprot:675373_1
MESVYRENLIDHIFRSSCCYAKYQRHCYVTSSPSPAVGRRRSSRKVFRYEWDAFSGLQKFFTGYVCESCDSAAHEQINNVAAQTRALTFQRFESVPDLLGYYTNEENQRLWREGGMYSMMPCSIHMAGLVFNKTDADGEWKYTIHTPEGCTPEMKKYIQSPPTSG